MSKLKDLKKGDVFVLKGFNFSLVVSEPLILSSAVCCLPLNGSTAFYLSEESDVCFLTTLDSIKL